ncbi:hypothetical protein AAP_02623 [Ascosphaera apis ARSEF 7405]|uniref:Uncharacterized protein n=1 Tax=Ascosphaera apis ARSEF 7405 TaxID=392613 RepID=A0A167ZVU6_9EURO|nr:hypothetical protein AAP_02623 [Ascosphaera apis ARSEF 7405]
MSANGDGTDTMSDMRDGNEEIGSANGRSSKRPSPRPSAGAPEEEEDSKLREFEMSLQSYDWETLQNKFAEAMEERTQAEMALQRETADLLEMFISWSQTTGLRDEDRAYKRFKTRMGFVQHSEMSLEDKKQHYTNVIKAFESALALLRDE